MNSSFLIVTAFACSAAIGCTHAVHTVTPKASGTNATSAENKAPELSPLHHVVRGIVAQGAVVGMCAARVDADGPPRTACAGRRHIAAPDELTPDDRFHLGSDAKAMTASLAGALVEKGVLDWDTTLAECFGDTRVQEQLRTVTLRDLLSHRSGITGSLTGPLSNVIGTLWQSRDDLASQRRWLVDLVLAQPPAHAPRTTFEYSNFGYIVAGAMLEARSGKSWEHLMEEYVFAPLGMQSCGFGAPRETHPNAPSGHQADGLGTIVAAPTGRESDNPAAFGPAGTIHCSINDWSLFLKAHLRGGRGESNFLRSETFRVLHTPPPIATPSEGPDYALGWTVIRNPRTNNWALTHAGSNTMFYVEAWLFPTTGRAYLVAENQGGSAAQKAADAAITSLFEYEPPVPKPTETPDATPTSTVSSPR